MAELRPTKILANRIDSRYVNQPHPLRRWRRVFNYAAAVIALAGIGAAALRVHGRRISVSNAIYTPGPVAHVHAMFGMQCAGCHDGGGERGGKFFKAVSDRACLRCHDAPIHQAHQRIAPAAGGVSSAALTLAVTAPDHPGGAHSADCTACHIEHRGAEALAATNDAICASCHANLKRATASGSAIRAANRVLGFTLEEHPRFGRKLRHGESWHDPTLLLFNHDTHFKQEGFKERDAEQNCRFCHSPQDPPADLKEPSRDSVPPWKSPKDRSAGAGASSDYRYMQPISYARHCAGCHPLELERDGPAVAHEELSLVRGQVAQASSLYAQKLRRMPTTQRDKALTQSRGRGPGKKISEADWAKAQLDKLAGPIEIALTGDEIKKRPGYEVLTAAVQASDAKWLDPTALEYYVAYGMHNSCVKCHQINDGAPYSPAATTQPTTQPTLLLATLPTGMPSSPRRWFTASVFDHRAHRDLACTSCHPQAIGSTQTSQLLLPDIGPTGGGGSCVECHRDSSTEPAVGGARATCVTCHQFHDRRLETPTVAALAR